MKNLGLIVALMLSVVTNVVLFKENKTIREHNDFKRELLNPALKALDKADYLIDKHDLYDTDGSDEMSDYLEYRSKVDSLVNTQL